MYMYLLGNHHSTSFVTNYASVHMHRRHTVIVLCVCVCVVCIFVSVNLIFWRVQLNAGNCSTNTVQQYLELNHVTFSQSDHSKHVTCQSIKLRRAHFTKALFLVWIAHLECCYGAFDFSDDQLAHSGSPCIFTLRSTQQLQRLVQATS